MSERAENPFWDFSLAVYGREGVAAACLGLQERHGLDVNLLLFGCWAGRRGRVLEAAEVARLIEAAGPWHEGVVRPLRAARRWLKAQDTASKSEAEALRARVKAAELSAEEIEQGLIAAALPVAAGEGAPGLAAANMNAYLDALGAARGADDTADLAAVLRGVWPELRPLDAVRLAAG
jgi:uncharacterized protein (TIGR02444 family)